MLVFLVTHAEQKRVLPFSEVPDEGMNFLSCVLFVQPMITDGIFFILKAQQ